MDAAEPTLLMKLAPACLGVGALLALIYWLVLVVIGFKASAGKGVLVLLLGTLGALIFACMDWQRAGGKFIAHLFGLGLIIAGFVMGVVDANQRMASPYEDFEPGLIEADVSSGTLDVGQ